MFHYGCTFPDSLHAIEYIRRPEYITIRGFPERYFLIAEVKYRGKRQIFRLDRYGAPDEYTMVELERKLLAWKKARDREAI